MISLKVFSSSNSKFIFGIIISLAWELGALNVIMFYFSVSDFFGKSAVFIGLAIALGIVSSPLLGWIGDAFIGRYKGAKYCIISLWTLSVLHGAAEVVMKYREESDNWIFSLLWKIIGIFTSAVGGFVLVCGFHFGLDQIADSPSWQVSSYVSWYCWSYFLVFVIKSVAFECTDKLIGIATITLVLSVAICLDFLCKQNVSIQSKSSNSLKLVYQVLKYAAKNKYPQTSSAFSYWDSKKSRIDLAKARYGGPFTADEVDDVKAFLKIIVIVVICVFLPGVFYTFTMFSGYKIMYHYRDLSLVQGTFDYRHCFVRSVIYNSASYILVLAIPLYECFIYPYIWKHVASITISKRFVVGIFLLFVTQLSYVTLETAGHYDVSSRNISVPCFLNATREDVVSNETIGLSVYWLILPQIFNAMSIYFWFTSGAEFLCAQSPYSMKSLLVGCMWSTVLTSSCCGIGLSYAFSFIPSTRYINCSISYFAFSFTASGFLVFVTCVAFWWYSKRRRRDDVENECADVGSSSSYGTFVRP